MDTEFHFYVTYILAAAAGFSEEDSYLIAYSSQYVDDNDIVYGIRENEEDEGYGNYISQTNDILKPQKKLMRIYPCFHFVPGDYAHETARRKDGKLSILNTTPNSPNANRLIDEALSTGDPYRIGIATHAFADSWAHQNFIGYFDSFNGIGGVLELITPNIGHADALHHPDIPGLKWKDSRLVTANEIVDNKKRFIEAAGFIFDKYQKHLNTKKKWDPLKKQLEAAIGEEFSGKDKYKKKRMARYLELLNQTVKNFIDYDQDEWFEEAVETKVRGLRDRDDIPVLGKLMVFSDRYFKKQGFENSRWYKFQEAVKQHQDYAETLYEDIFKQMEVKEY